MTGMNRRSLIQGSLALGAAGFIGAAEASTQAKVPSKWDATYDVVVVGSGFAGLAAAIEAKKAGASCVVLENPVWSCTEKEPPRRRQLHY
ncbi:putative uncharacterized protein [Sutterella sp. CAG:397]|nr:putative uncharacterized protein [Sutterella sp. CAG:397]